MFQTNPLSLKAPDAVFIQFEISPWISWAALSSIVIRPSRSVILSSIGASGFLYRGEAPLEEQFWAAKAKPNNRDAAHIIVRMVLARTRTTGPPGYLAERRQRVKVSKERDTRFEKKSLDQKERLDLNGRRTIFISLSTHSIGDAS